MVLFYNLSYLRLLIGQYFGACFIKEKLNFMKQLFILFAAVLIVSCQPKPEKIKYPMTKKVDTVDVYFGHKVADPYRWLENDTSAETAEWVKAENQVTQNYMSKIPFRQAVEDRLTKLWNYPKISAPLHKAGNYFVFKNDGLQNQSVVYIKNTIEGDEKVFLDPNKLSKDGTVALTNFTPSKDGKYVGYAISRGGSDWRELYVRSIKTGKDLADHIMWAKFSNISWYKNGFFYSRYPEPKKGDALKGENENSKVYYHQIGTSQDTDKLIYEDPDHPLWGFNAKVTDDDQYLVLEVTESTSGNALYVKDLTGDNDFVKVVETFDNDYLVIDHINGKLLVYTDLDAPKYKVIAIDMKHPEPDSWIDFIPEKESVLQEVSIHGGKIIANYLKDAHSNIEIYNLKGEFLYNLDNTTLGTISGFRGERNDSTTFYAITTFTSPATIYKYDISANKSDVYQKTDVDFNAADYETKQVFYPSKDGTEIPMFIVYKKGTQLNGKNPLMLYGYGGFNISLTPTFNIGRLLWLEQGGIFAMANLRGGGEYGEDWHQAGTKMNKQNVFDDCIAAAEYLINEKYTSKGRIVMTGRSNGGLLVGAVVNQRPDLFGVAFPTVGVMDMLRYHKFTIGRYWATDYGTSEDSEEMFKYLLSYSPLHNIKENVDYPAILVSTGDHDDRVVPAHSFKYAATLQEKYKGTNPVLIHIESQAGHGPGKPTAKLIQEESDIYSFMFYNMGITPRY